MKFVDDDDDDDDDDDETLKNLNKQLQYHDI